jgi:gliding motility-associated-like protein
MTRRAICFICSVVLLIGDDRAVIAQDQYLSTFNYRTLAVTPIGHIPGVNWVSGDNSAYDANHQRFFFQGGANQQPPWNLFTTDATTGAVLFNPVVPAGNTKGLLAGLQYDNNVDTLYATYFDGAGNIFLAWVDFSTGIAYPKQSIPGFTGYVGSTYDTKDHLYIGYNGQQLVALDARTGNLVYSGTFPAQTAALDLVFDNANSTLYGISVPAGGVATFDSISLTSTTFYPLVFLTVSSFPQISAYTIDETGGNFVFVGTLPGAVECINYQLFTVNLASATIVESMLYPYAQDPTDPLDSNLLEYSFDNRRGTLYALNWRPTLQTIPPIFTISAASNPACPGGPDTLTAVLASPLTADMYQWQVNNQPVGGNTPVYTDTNPGDGDSIRCILTAITVCGSVLTDTSGPVVLTLLHPAYATITTSANNICAGDTVFFQAVSVNGGANPQFQWQVNGMPVGTNSDIFSSRALSEGDTVCCILNGSATCLPPVASADNVIMTVRPSPGLQMPSDTLIARGQEVQLSPAVQGGVTTWQWQPPAGLSDPSISDPIASPVNTTTYSLTVTANDGCSVSGKITVRVYTPLAMPNAFTPNGDGKNDVFRIPPSISIQLSQFSIFDRWGQKVFATANPAEGWNGTVAGHPAPSGAYVWMVEYIDPLNGKRMVGSGTVILVR